MFFNVLVVGWALPVLALPSFIRADGVNAFYSSNYAKSIYSSGDKAEANLEDNQGDSDAAAKLSQDKLLKEYGDPAVDPAINVVDNAPKPFKAMMAALEADDDQLAFKYARQYVRYLHRLQERTNKVMGIVGLAGEREGINNEEGWQTAPQFDKYRPILEKDLSEDNNAAEGAINVAKLDDRTLAVLDEAERQESAATKKMEGKRAAQQAETKAQFKEAALRAKGKSPSANNTTARASYDEKAERARVRNELRNQIQPDPQGKVDLYFFFRSNERLSLAMFKEIEQLYQSIRGDTRINFIALTLDDLSPAEVEQLRTQKQVTFPIKNGTTFSHKLNVTKTPTTVVVSASTGKALFEDGFRRFFYLDEVVKMMRGR